LYTKQPQATFPAMIKIASHRRLFPFVTAFAIHMFIPLQAGVMLQQPKNS